MLEYPSIVSSSKAPRKPMIAFEKLDGSNIRVKWTAKRGFYLFGSRTQLVDPSHLELGGVVSVFNETCKEELERLVQKNFKNAKEVVAFGEYVGPNSFAGVHTDPVTQMRFVLFDLLIRAKAAEAFVSPQEFVKLTSRLSMPAARVVYEGTLGEEFIQRVRSNSLEVPLDEGVVCKGREKATNYAGNVWMCKIKTLGYLEKLKERYGDAWSHYWE